MFTKPERDALLNHIMLLKEKLASVSSDEDKSSLNSYILLAEQTLSELDANNSLAGHLHLFERLKGNTWLKNTEDFEEIHESWNHFTSLFSEASGKKRRYQFSIQDIMIWTTVIAVFLAIVTQTPVIVQIALTFHGCLVFSYVGIWSKKYWPFGIVLLLVAYLIYLTREYFHVISQLLI